MVNLWRIAFLALAIGGCAATQYAVRPTPVPEESAEALAIERAISRVQAQTFERLGARLIAAGERPWGFDVRGVLERLRRVTERPHLAYRAYLYAEDDPNAAALADGRIYLSTGMLQYLGSRGSRTDELAVVMAHELAHTAAQHLVKRYRRIQQQQVVLGLVAAGASAAARGAGLGDAAGLARDVASLLNEVALSGYSQEQELEADQLGIRYMQRAGFEPKAALALLEDFARFDRPGVFLSTHPYSAERRAQLERYLLEHGPRPAAPSAPSPDPAASAARVRHLRDVQRQYPAGSVSWTNLQRQIDAAESARP